MTLIQTLNRKWAELWRLVGAISPVHALRVALGVWILYAVIIATLVAVQPDRRSATLEYQWATQNWWGGEKSLYRKKNGYLYLPQFAIFYTPYELLPDRVGEPLWRLTCLASLALALWVTVSHLSRENRNTLFLLATVIVLPSSFASARNGQVNMPLAALFLLTAVALARERWWAAAGMLAVTLILKPIALAPILLCAALYPKLRLPMLACLVATALLPFAHFNPAYAAGEYVNFTKNLTQAGAPKAGTWCDFMGMLNKFGVELPSFIQLAARALAGVLTLGLCWKALRSLDALRGAILVLFLATVYLMLFNPRTETNSYVMLGAFVAVFGAYAGLVGRRLGEAADFVLLAAILGTENYGYPIFPWTNLWLKALATCVLAAWLAVKLLNGPASARTLLAASPDVPAR